MKKFRETAFILICVFFSVTLLVLCLVSSIELNRVNDLATDCESEIGILKTENEILRAEFENSLSLEELETYAVEVLGMQHCSPGQIVYIEHTDTVG